MRQSGLALPLKLDIPSLLTQDGFEFWRKVQYVFGLGRRRVAGGKGDSLGNLASSLFFLEFLLILKADFPFLCVLSRSVLSDSLRPHGLQTDRLLCVWGSPGKNAGMGYHSLLQGIFPTQGSTLSLPCLLHCRQILYGLSHQGILPFLQSVKNSSLRIHGLCWKQSATSD